MHYSSAVCAQGKEGVTKSGDEGELSSDDRLALIILLDKHKVMVQDCVRHVVDVPEDKPVVPTPTDDVTPPKKHISWHFKVKKHDGPPKRRSIPGKLS